MANQYYTGIQPFRVSIGEAISAANERYSQPQQTQQSQDDLARMREFQKAQEYNPKTIPNPLERQVSANPLDNILGNLNEIGTGLAYIGTHPKEVISQGVDYLKNRYGEDFKNHPLETLLAGSPLAMVNSNSRNVRNKISEDAFNFLMSNYDVTQKDLYDIAAGKQSLGQVLTRGAVNAYKNPIDTTLDILTLGGGKALKGLRKGASAAEKSQKAIDLANQKVKSQVQKVIDQSQDFKKVGTTADRIGAIEALETGKNVTGNTKKATKVLSKMVDEYDKAVPERAKINNFEAAHNQRMVREGLAQSTLDADNLTQAYKTTKKIKGKETVDFDFEDLKKLAAEGDVGASEILKSKELFDKGYLKLVPHGLAEVAKDTLSEALAKGKEHRFFQGKYSERVYGTAKYEDIAKQLEDPNLWIDAQTKAFVEQTIADEMLKEGKLGGLPLADESSKAVQYIDRATLEQGDVTKALASARDTLAKDTDIAIDKSLVKELKNQLDTTNGIKPFGNTFMNDMYSVGKRNALAAGSYLAGNLYTGVANAFMNTGLNPLGMAQDFVEAIATKGKISKEAGVYRNLKRSKSTVSTPVLKQVDQINAPVSNVLNAMDASIQNTISEMTLNRNLRKQGIALSKRAEAINDLGKEKLAEVINDARAIALYNPSKTILPKALHGGAGILNPFWRWMDTAAQASVYMLEKHPNVSNIVYNKIAHQIAFDKEAQNRMNLNVASDKPFVSYKFNQKTGKIQEMSSEFLPAMNTMKLIGNTAKAVKEHKFDELPVALDPANTVFWGSVMGAVKGVNRYGKPIMRPEIDRPEKLSYILNNERYRYNIETGQWDKIGGFQGDEILNTAVNELLAYPRLANKTIAPALAGAYNLLTGDNIRYYQPYQSQLLGEFAPAGQMPENANPRSSKAGEESLNQLLGIYTRDYDPSYEERKDILSKNDIRRMMRGGARRYGRTQEMLNRYR